MFNVFLHHRGQEQKVNEVPLNRASAVKLFNSLVDDYGRDFVRIEEA